jgi:hypothetical protein
VALKIIKLGMDTRSVTPGLRRSGGTGHDGSSEYRQGIDAG